MNVEKTTRIARNTLLLYGRMFVQMIVALYASRVVLHTLGVGDNNIYAVVGSFVALFWFLNTAMATATQRFLNVEMERGDCESQRRVFSMSVNIHVGIALVVLVLGETVGLWFVITKLNIAPERMAAAHWVYQLSLLTSCFNIVRVPYNAAIVAHERMSMYAWLTLAEAGLRLVSVWLLIVLAGDKLILYAALTAVVVLGVTLIYRYYCRRRFDICRYKFTRDGALARRMTGFSGWSLLGSGANAASMHGINVLLNVMLGGVLNVAMEKAAQVSNSVNAFVMNFQTAFNPQIMKSYAAGDMAYFRYLIFRASKYSYFLLLVIALPVMLCAVPLLDLWLGAGAVPDHTASFMRLLMATLLIDAAAGPLWSAVQATGKIRAYQIMMSALTFLSLPLAWLAVRMGYPPESALAVRVGVSVVAFFVRIAYVGLRLAFPVGQYLRQVALVLVVVTVLVVPVPWAVSRFVAGGGFSGIAVVTFASVVWAGLVIFVVGMRASERKFLIDAVRKRIRKR